MQVIATQADLVEGLERLLALDPRLHPVARVAGLLPLRRQPADLAGLVQIITAQQVSVASAAAIFQRLRLLIDPFERDTLAGLEDADLAAAGLSRPKIRTLRAVVAALDEGLDLAALAGCPAKDAHRRLCEIRGIGPWTADIFLLFCAGHPDIFPSGDLALREAVRQAFEMPQRPVPKVVDGLAERWAPVRGIAARLFWSYYRAVSGRSGLPVAAAGAE